MRTGPGAPRARRGVILVAIVAIGALALLAGCGSQTKTVSVSSAPEESTSSTVAQTTTTVTNSSSATSTSSEAPEEAQSVTTTQAATSSRTSSQPAFLGKKTESSEGASAAVATVEGLGYKPTDTSQYHSSQTLTVLVGSSGSAQQAFFFIDGKYIGTDTKQPSASVSVVSQADTEVVLSYGLYNTAEEAVGQAKVRFQLDDGKLTALDAIPPVHPSGSADGRL